MNRNVLILVAVVSALALSCGGKKSGKDDMVYNPATADQNGSSKAKAEITFEETKHDFGEVIEGQVVETDFKFKNTGTNDLVIYDAVGSCGCTVPSYPKDPIRPGETGAIHVKFDSTGKPGHNSKDVTLTCNTQPNQIQLQITGDVVAK